MSTTITIRTDKSLRDALARRAKAQRKTVSHVVREILEDALVERPLGEKIGRLRGGLRVAEPPVGSWQRQIRERNWRP
jgi:predicted transcriptional regulator